MSQIINIAAITLFEEFNDQFTLEQLSQKRRFHALHFIDVLAVKMLLLKKLSDQGLIKLDQQTDIKSRIFKATRVVVSEHGFINCTIEQIAKEAGLGVATLYRHFSEKENLLHAFTSELNAQLNILSISKKSADKFEDSLPLLVESLLLFINENKDLVRLVFFGAPAERKYINTIRNASVSTFASISRYLKNFQEQGQITAHIDTDDMATSLVGLILHFSITSPQHFNRRLNIKRDAQTIAQLVCHGICSLEGDTK